MKKFSNLAATCPSVTHLFRTFLGWEPARFGSFALLSPSRPPTQPAGAHAVPYGGWARVPRCPALAGLLVTRAATALPAAQGAAGSMPRSLRSGAVTSRAGLPPAPFRRGPSPHAALSPAPFGRRGPSAAPRPRLGRPFRRPLLGAAAGRACFGRRGLGGGGLRSPLPPAPRPPPSPGFSPRPRSLARSPFVELGLTIPNPSAGGYGQAPRGNFVTPRRGTIPPPRRWRG